MSIPEWNTKGFPLLWHSAHILLGEDACSLVYLVQETRQRLSQSLEAEEPKRLCSAPQSTVTKHGRLLLWVNVEGLLPLILPL